MITKSRKTDHITPILHNLHWLPVRERIVFKNLIFVYRILTNETAFYLSDLIERYVPGRSNLRSSNPDLFLLKRKDSRVTTKSYGWRAFYIYAPMLWNSLPLYVRQSHPLNNFKRNLKTHLFKNCFKS